MAVVAPPNACGPCSDERLTVQLDITYIANSSNVVKQMIVVVLLSSRGECPVTGGLLGGREALHGVVTGFMYGVQRKLM